ncbi:DUF2207 domain-containing protein [Cryobacterium sp. SO1]|uniref:DUF2207 domain-containing protein n=1 Tax=Cryobacterium sp. SO1 TaxID=1897061 RepID=UPI0010239061|nr:DUF2207 domain-containing protein [Cryobacterium sp. SO1]RZI34408.1 hypothetical protein BJQ95_03211 [Cryobacterium sp. SO1]
MTRFLKVLSGLVIASVLALGAPVAAMAVAPGSLGVAGGTATAVSAGSAVPANVAGLSARSSLAGSARAAVPADTSDFTFASYAGEYYLDRDSIGHSTLRTVERFVAEFPDFDQNRGIIRAIPNDYDGVPLNTSVESVTDAAGDPVYFETEVSNGFTELALGTDEFVRGTQTYVISYTQQNVVRAFADTNDDELYWDTNGTGFDQPFGSVTARVHVAPAIAPFLTGNSACYTGAQGESGACQIVQEADPDAAVPDTAAPEAATGQLFTAEATNLGPGENLTVAIGFTAGTFVQVPAQAQPDSNTAPGFGPAAVLGGFPFGLLGIALLGGVFALARVFVRPRDPKPGTIIAQYSVPQGYNLLEAADLIGRTRSAMAAQIVSFAVRGKVRILDYPVSATGGDYTLQLLAVDGVDDQELAVLATLFPGLAEGAVCELGVTNDALARGLAAATADATVRNTARGCRARPALTRTRIRVLIGLAAVVVFVVAVLAIANPPSVWWSPLLLLAAATVIVGVAVSRRPVLLSAAGVERRDYLTGMKVYLDLAEADRFRMLQSPEGALRVTVPRTVPGAQPAAAGTQAAASGASAAGTVERVKLYEKLLPYAVLWGVEREWAAELAVYYEQDATPPGWFVSQNAFSGIYLASALNGIVNSVHTTETPTPPPSTWSGSGGGSFSGGSFGGGFSGGGGGGGGGGGR